MHRQAFGSGLLWVVALVAVSACGSVPKQEPDAGGCTDVPTQEQACADKCGEVVVCGASFTCGGCTGELMCGAKTENTCGCASSPCAISDFTAGDANVQTLVDIAVDASGNVFAAGDFRGTVTFGDKMYTSGPTRPDMFLVKLSPTGDVLWSKAFTDVTGDSEQTVSAIEVDATGNVVLVGYSYGATNLGGSNLGAASSGDMVIGKYDNNGTHIFSAVYGTNFSIDATALAIDKASQDIIVTGRFWGTLQFGSLGSMTAAGTDAYFDIFLVRFSASGVPASSKRYGDGAEQIPEALAVSGSNVYLSAYFTGTYDYGAPNTTPVSTNTFYSLALTKLGLGSFPHSWTKKYGTVVSDSRLAADASGNVYLSGVFSGSLDITSPAFQSTAGTAFLAKIDANGATTWAKQFANLEIAQVTTTNDGVFVAGYVTGEVDLGGGPVAYSGSNDPFVAHYGADGAHKWSRVFAGAVGSQRAAAIAVAGNGTTWVGHNFDGTIDFGLGAVTTQGGTDIAVIGYVP